MSGSTPPTLLDALYGVGERMYEALAAEDLDTFFSLVHERGTLLDELRTYDHPADVDPRWEARAAALAEQHRVLSDAVAAHERRLGASLAAVERYHAAQQHYRQRPRSGTILGNHVSG